MTWKPRHILFVLSNFPWPGDPASGMFTEQLIRRYASMGIRCTVIHPVAVHRYVKTGLSPRRFRISVEGGEPIEVIRPLFPSLYLRLVGPLNLFSATRALFRRAVRRSLHLVRGVPDLVYGHFLLLSGESAIETGHHFQVPSFVAVGESNLDEFPDYVPLDRFRRRLSQAHGFISVSSVIRGQLEDLYRIRPERIGVFPNGVDRARFFPREKKAMRESLWLDPDAFIVAFAGIFEHRKGPQRVSDALKGVPGALGVFLGKGPSLPAEPHIAFQGPVPHPRVAEYLSAADVFVLPTLGEGSCNALVEAMACGLPLITSDRDFNRDLVTDQSSLLVDPMDVSAIRKAILRLKQGEELRQRMAEATLARAAELDLSVRAEKILSFINERRFTETS